MRKLLILAALFSAQAVAQTTITVPAQTVTVKIPAQTIKIPAQNGGGTTTTPAAGTFWVYHAVNGIVTRGWTCDVSYGDHNVDYANPDPSAPGGVDIAVKGETGFQPDICSQDFDTTGYTALIFSIKPTQPMTDVITGAMLKGDTPIPNAPPPFQIGPYCTPQITVGSWSQCKIPLSAYGLSPGQHIYKFMIQRQTPTPAGQVYVYYVADIGFVP
jgi:hypothetical protein